VATVEEGRVVRLQGDPEHPVTRGFLCYRTSHLLESEYYRQRLTTPLMRVDGELRPVGWDEALDVAAERLTAIRRESGPAAIFHYRSGGSLGLLKSLSDYFFERFGPVTVKRGDICSGAGEAAQMMDFGDCDSHDLFDLHNSRNILLWGKNVFTSSPHTIPVLREAAERGARLALVDPVRHRTASICDLYAQPRPGGDFALAMAVARTLFERDGPIRKRRAIATNLDQFRALALGRSVAAWCEAADVGVDTARELARRLGPGRPCAILVGWGMGRRVNGAGIVRALDALGAISGNLGIPGGGVSFYFKRRAAFEPPSSAVPRSPPRTVCEPLFGADVLAASDPPIRAVWVTAGNPVAMLPESGTTRAALRTRDFVGRRRLVPDGHRAARAPRAADDDPARGGRPARLVRPPLARRSRDRSSPAPGVRSDLEIVQGLAARVGLGDALAGDARAWKRRMMRGTLEPLGVTSRISRPAGQEPVAAPCSSRTGASPPRAAGST
jgi:anaerobic selenocysteine-containing dehydrogenase